MNLLPHYHKFVVQFWNSGTEVLIGNFLPKYPECSCSVTQLCLTLCDPMDNSPPDSSIHGIFQARILEWVAMSSSQPRDWTHISCIAGCLRHQDSPRILEWVAYPFSRGTSPPRNQTGVSCVTGRFFTSWNLTIWRFLKKLELETTTWLAISLLCIYLKTKKKTSNLKMYMCLGVYCSIIYNS